MDDEDVCNRVAWLLATEIADSSAPRENVSMVANAVVEAHRRGRIDLLGDIDVALEKMRRAFA